MRIWFAEDDGMSLMEMTDQLDGIDKQDFHAAIERATSCTRMRDFTCAEAELAKAAKVANDGKDKKILLASRQSLANEKQELANEKRRAEEARRREEEERQARIRREEEAEREREERRRRAEQAEEDSSYSASNDIGMHILQTGQEMSAMMANLDRQTAAAYAETNRRLAEQAAERKRAKEEQEEREADRRREARRSEEARQSRERVAQADAHEREEQSRREAERAAEKQRQEREAQQREEQRRKEEQAQRELARQQQLQRQREEAERLAKKQAEKAAEQQAKNDYLNAMRSGIRLSAIKCLDGEGHYYAVGTMPKIKRALSCIDVHYKAYCPGSAAYSSGVADNFQGVPGCFGDPYKIAPKPACPVEQVRIEVTDVRDGCN